MQKSEITERREAVPPPAASCNDIESPSNGELYLDEIEEVISRRSFQVAPSIAPPIPDVQAFLQATKDSQDELEERDGIIMKEIAAGRLRLDKPSNSNNSNGEDNTDEETGGRDDASNNEEQHSSSSSRRQQGEPSVLRNDVVTFEEESESINSTIVYDGSIARVEAVVGSPPPITNSESTNSQQPADSSRPLEIPEAYLVTSTMGRSMFPWMTRTSLPIAVHAEPIQPWYKQPWGKFIAGVVILLVCALIIFTGVYVSQKKGDPLEEAEVTSAPSFAPTFDPSPTLDIVRSRGELWCGLDPEQNSTTPINYIGFTTDLCRAVASVVLGDPEKYKRIIVTREDQFAKLIGREVDLVLLGKVHTLEREVNEQSTGSGFSFSAPFIITNIVYLGEKAYVECAEGQIRFGDICSNLKICVPEGSLAIEVVSPAFPSSFFESVTSVNELDEMLNDGTCNVVVYDIYSLMQSPSIYNAVQSGKYVFSNNTLTNEPLSITTRNVDPQWSDIAEGVVWGILQGWEDNVTQDLSLCPLSSSNNQLSFMNAPICVGNYAEIHGRYLPTAFLPGRSNNTIHGSEGAIHSPRFGDLNCPSCNDALKSGTLEEIYQRKKLNCGVVDDSENPNLVLMSEIYCHAIAAAIFQGDVSAANITHLGPSFNESLLPFTEGAFDVIAGGWPDRSDWSLDLSSGKIVFSLPYYYTNWENRNNTRKEISLVTREGDVLFSSFANTVVMATVYAVENGISREGKSMEMPLIELFGSNLKWMLRDVIHHIGSYNDIYSDTHGQDLDRGWNQVNLEWGHHEWN
eukprot:CAMPEP_0201869988 /NCGR_PEP_ID=MMETSP0902-20130614/3284_1 /ASSEMBLY_ACC=CAM_ASM_000551 /TAXON_ID=420261 /ORGANISM="Thalassiosira antarctica, Strain CCMP982" /LENGTH=799 /DNA_ID=CAMNT_0048395557 /DNA_START=157 /DNA_END=2553 /DNA_ORIENTATION=-